MIPTVLAVFAKEVSRKMSNDVQVAFLAFHFEACIAQILAANW
jgi:hypothetical protein